jgi:hypothetical protein
MNNRGGPQPPGHRRPKPLVCPCCAGDRVNVDGGLTVRRGETKVPVLCSACGHRWDSKHGGVIRRLQREADDRRAAMGVR